MPETKPLPQTQDPMLSLVLERRLVGRRQAFVGIAGTILLHLLGWLMIPSDLFHAEPTEPVDRFQDFSIELAQPEEEPPEMIYTQTNPDVPENEPDETNRFGARDQQAANPEEPEELDPENRPATESEDNIETDQFLTGSLDDPLLAPPPTETQEPQEAAEPQKEGQQQPLLQAIEPAEEAAKQEIPIAGSLEDAELDEEGIADFDHDEQSEAPTNLSELVEGEEEAREEAREASPAQLTQGGQPSPPLESVDGLPSPKPRPQLPRLPTAPTRNSTTGVTSQGVLSADAKGTEFGEYMDRLIETVSIKWDDLATRSSHSERNSKVRIRFVLTQHGYVSDIEILEGTSARAIGIYMCREAIQQGVPFGPWPAGLVQMFGEDEEINFTFHYR